MRTSIGYNNYSIEAIRLHKAYKQTVAKGKQAIKQLLKKKADSDLKEAYNEKH